VRIVPTVLPGVAVVETRTHRDERGWFRELWREEAYRDALGVPPFVQDNVSRSGRGVLRGLHVQHPQPQGKLVSVLEGEIWDVAVDVRAGSPTAGRWVAETLTAEGGRQLWIPAGFAHGFVVLSDAAVVHYRCTAPYRRDADRAVLWSDPELAIPWPVAEPILSPRDAAAPPLRDIPPGALPPFEGR
jgi:dTDP-4-dehydrorhamnose 3,5-epimerase